MEEGRFVDIERLKNDAEQLKNLGAEDAVEMVAGYHKMICKSVSECLEQINKVTKLSPATIPITETAIIIAERDIVDRKLNKKGAVAILGLKDEVADLLNQLWESIPEVFEEVTRQHGFVKSEECK